MIKWFKSLFKHKEVWDMGTTIGIFKIKVVKVKRDKLGRFKK
jgi:hypothetical protein